MRHLKLSDEDFANYDILKDENDDNLKKRELYFYLTLKFLERKFSNISYAENILENIKGILLENLTQTEIEEIDINFEAFYEKLFKDYKEDPDLKSILDIFEIKEKFKEILTKPK